MISYAPQGNLIYEQFDPALAAQIARLHQLAPTERQQLASELRDALAACAAYVPARLVRAQLADPMPGRVGGAFWQGSLLFADLSGFTALSENMSVLGKQGAEEISALVNQIFDALIAEVHTYQGMLLKFGGDALTAFFDAETLGSAHPGAATSAALAMQRCMETFTDLQTRVGTFRLELRVGVHSGRVFAAEVGDRSHIELVVTGSDVNRVALAQEIAAPGEVVISDQTATLLEGARLEQRSDGFQRIKSLLYFWLPPKPSDLIARDGPDDVATLELLAQQIIALRPYLVRQLPWRFLASVANELGEFRPVSVLFANVQNFSALLDQLGEDATTAAAMLNAYYKRAQIVIHRYGGIVNKVDMYTHGDKLMALFGAPSAHEDDPLRAVRCALELDQALAAANTEISALLSDDRVTRWQGDKVKPETDATPSPRHLVTLSQKIGLSTGTVFAGRVGGGRRYEYTVMGPAVNLSARLMAKATDGSVLLSPATRTAVTRQVEVVDQPPLLLKGLATPVVPARAVRILADERSVHSAAETSLGRAPLVGREDELALALATAQTALSGSGHVLALVSDAGVGKTRLIEEVLQHLVMHSGLAATDIPPFVTYLVDAQSYNQSTPYAVARELLRQFFHLNTNNTRSDPIAALVARVATHAPELVRFTPLLGDVLGIDLEETPLTTALPPEQRRDRTHELVATLFAAEAQTQPLLLIVDDLHWADASSLELLQLLAQHIAHVPILLLLSYRPDADLTELWGDLEHCVVLGLGELSHDSSTTLLRGLLNSEPPLGLATLIEKTQGNPFFTEEVVRSLVESGTLQRNGTGWVLTGELDDVTIPDSVEGVITARLDRLEDRSREVLQVASVIGRRFPYQLLANVARQRDTISKHIQQLAKSDLIISEELERDLAYMFRHALTRDVAYEAILYSRRRELHRRVARQIEQEHRDHLDEYGALLAGHYLLAEDWQPAFRYHVAAGISAQERYANREALTLLGGALAIISRSVKASDSSAMYAQQAELHERCGDIRVLLGEYDRAHQSYMQALALADAEQAALSERRVRLHRLLATVEERRSHYDAAFSWLEQGMVCAKSDARLEVARCYLLGAGIYQRQGEYTHSMEWARLGASIAETLSSRAEQAHASLLMGNLWEDQGEFSLSIPALEQARALFEQINDVTRVSNALNNLGVVYLQVGRWQDAIASYERSLAISESTGNAEGMARTSNNLALVLLEQGELQRANELYKYSNEQFGRIGSTLGVAVTSHNRGEVLLLQGDPQKALSLFHESITLLEQIKARNFLPEVLRLSAEATLALDDTAQAASYANQSLDIARELGIAVDEAAARRVLGQIALQRHDLLAAQRAFEQSRASLEQLDNRYELGKVIYWQARLAAVVGQTEHACAAAKHAQEIFSQLLAQRDLTLVRDLLEEIACLEQSAVGSS